jgi:hypothetical protein
MPSSTFFDGNHRADELFIHPANDSDLHVPMGSGIDDYLELLCAVLAVLAVLTMFVWFRAGLVPRSLGW